jgi:hypothetical protein
MNREDIIRMAREAGCIEPGIGGDPDGLWEPSGWENVTNLMFKFADLVAAHEREGCVKVVEYLLDKVVGYLNKESAEQKMIKTITCSFKEEITNAIRARGEK